MRHRFFPIACNQAQTVFFGIVGIILVSHIVPKKVYGAYGLFLTLMQVGILLTHSGLINHASRYWQRERSQASGYARFLLSRTWRYSAPLALMLLVCALVLASQEGAVWLQLWPLLVISNVVMALYTVALSMLNAAERHWAVLGLSALSSSARALLPVGLALLVGASLFTLSLGFTVHALLVGLALFFLFQRAWRTSGPDPELERKWGAELRNFGRPFVIMGAGGWLLQYADRWVVGFVFGQEPLGVFNLATNIASVVPNMVAAGVLQWVFPAVFRQADAAHTAADWRMLARRCDQFTLLYLGLTVAGLGCLALLGPYLVGSIISAQYAASIPLFLPAGLAAAASQANQFQYLLLQGQHDSGSMARVMLLLAGIRTAGSIAAAAMSWPVFVGWLVASTVLVSLLGRFRIQQIAFRRINARAEGELVNPGR
jgi:O-antigen/teichoic acid export membrane protein